MCILDGQDMCVMLEYLVTQHCIEKDKKGDLLRQWVEPLGGRDKPLVIFGDPAFLAHEGLSR